MSQLTAGVQSESVLPGGANAPRIRDVSKEIALLDNVDAPVATLLKHPKSPLKKSSVTNIKYEWQERERFPWVGKISGAQTNVDTAIEVVAGQGVYGRKGDLVLLPATGEIMLISARATDTWTCTRGAAGTVAAAIADQAEFLIIGSAWAENSQVAAADARASWPDFMYNYTQIAKTPFGWSNSLKASALYTGNLRDEDTKFWGEEHMRKLERSLMYGERSQSGDDRTMRGILKFITTKVQAAGGVLTEAAWEDFNELAFEFGNPKRVKICLVSRFVRTIINRFASVRLRTRNGENSYGLKIEEYDGPHGQLLLITHDILQGATYKGYAVVLDPMSPEYVYLEGNGTKRDTYLSPENELANGTDGEMLQFLTECGLKFRLEKANAVLTGVTG